MSFDAKFMYNILPKIMKICQYLFKLEPKMSRIFFETV